MLEKKYSKMIKVNNFIDDIRISRLPKVKGVVHRIFSMIANMEYVKFLSNNQLDTSYYNREKELNIDKKIIVSLTTFPKRIDTVWITLESLLRQSIKPDKMILWLAKSEFADGLNSLPASLMNLIDRGLEIRFCENLKPHKKYYYSMKEFPDDIVITVDDDVLYPPDLIKDLILLHLKFPKCICCTRGHLITIDNQNNIQLYSKWIKNPSVEEIPSKFICPTGVGGVLYPPKSLHPEVFNKDNIIRLSLNADDLWLKVMSLMKGTEIVKSHKYDYEFFSISKTHYSALSKTNVVQNHNDVQLNAILEEYNIKLYD
ncbi:hypothetical protein [Sedimentibacter sp. B4]|uniref:hypothetical protein n=1 Tax=Sedimentibacter sp. B4 TaxID=304766 RepID=UPI0002D6419F|nr:hypothetical protein [Sedimentibacter sp. B4]